MDSPLFMNDFLLLISAIGSSIIGAICGWQFRSIHYQASLASATTLTQLVGEQPPESLTTVMVQPPEVPLAPDTSSFLSTYETEQTRSGDNAPSFIDHEESFASVNGPQPRALTQLEIHEVAQRLLQMADRITEDVDAHDARLHEVSDSLETKQEMPTMEFVLAAVQRLVVANETIQSQLRESRHRIIDQARQIETAEQRANTDALTRIANRRAFDAELANWNGQTPGVLALLDIDHFKRFNDEHGHRAGDEVLRTVASLLKSELEDECMVARYGGEEFALVFTNHRLENVIEMIEKARRAVADHKTTFNGKTFQVTCSLGVTRMVAGEPSIEWIQRADEGLYLSKDAGRNCGHCIDCQLIGKRETPFRLGTAADDAAKPRKTTAAAPAVPTFRQPVSQSLFDRIPNCQSLSESYRELLQRLGKAPVRLSVIAITVAQPEKLIETSREANEATRFSQTHDVAQAFCRPLDRIGYLDDQTLLICMPGIDHNALMERMLQLQDIVLKQLQIDMSELTIGCASIETGDTFDRMVQRAIAHACAAV